MGFWFGDNARPTVGVGEGAVLIREWPLVEEAEGPTGYLVGGTQQAPTPLYLSIPCPPETLGWGGGAGSWQISHTHTHQYPLPPAWSLEGNRGVEILQDMGIRSRPKS